MLGLLIGLTICVVAIETKVDLVLKDASVTIGDSFVYQIGDHAFLSIYKIQRVAERGKKYLPPWLKFHLDSGQLSGIPHASDVGLYAVRVKAICINPVVLACQDRVSRTFHINVIEPLKDAQAREIPDEPPRLEKSIDHLVVVVGRYFTFTIPTNTFNDTEDGTTRNLTLRITQAYGKALPDNAWLKFNDTSQTLYGLPLKQDFREDNGKMIQKFTLTAFDSKGHVAKDAISLTYRYEEEISHKVTLKFNTSFDEFESSRANLISAAWKLARFYKQDNLKHFTFFSLSEGSVSIVWGNHSLFGAQCRLNDIKQMFSKLIYNNGSLVREFVGLFSMLEPISASLDFEGACLVPPPTQAPVTGQDNSKMWLEIVLPALIVILIIVIIALVLLICCRHRKPPKDVSQTEKPSFLEDRRPIIFPEELEMVDPSLKPQKPLVLPSDYLAETPPAVPPHGQLNPPSYRTPALDDELFSPDHHASPSPPMYGSTSSASDPPPYRLPPPYYNPHRLV